MATQPTEIVPAGRLTVQAQKNVIEFFQRIADVHRANNELQGKMDAIDVAYARYNAVKAGSLMVDGVDNRRDASTSCDIFQADDVTPPIVVSQVDSYVAYLAETFLSGYPLFPVVSNPSNKVWAEQLETLMDDHAAIGGYARQLLMFLRDGVKFNYSALEVFWTDIEQFTVAETFESTGKKINRTPKGYTRIKRLNPRNVFRDNSICPADVAEEGDYAGYVERISRMKLKKELNSLTIKHKAYNIDKALTSTSAASGSTPSNLYRDDPQISDYITQLRSANKEVDWDVWFDGHKANNGRTSYGQMYERAVVYARISPSDFGITAPMPNTPQIWKFIIINNQILISAERIISAYDYLPILFGQPLEDGLGEQTQSVGESEVPFQTAVATLINIRFAASRRAVSDRAIFDESALKSSDVNSQAAAPKIPAKISTLSNKKLQDLYYQIPFDMRGTESAIQDAQTIVGFSKELHGINSPRQGQFQKGNKSVTEWEDTMGGSDGRMRLPAMTLEHQVFGPLKSIIVLNIYQYGSDSIVVSQRTGQTIKIDLNKLREQVLAFRIADGFTPKSKLASVQMISTGLQMISTSPILQQSYGSMLPKMFAHLMQLGGVRGLEEYDPNYVNEGVGTNQNNLQADPSMQVESPVETPSALGNIP